MKADKLNGTQRSVRDLHDIEIDDLRRQVQQLQQCLEHYKPLERDNPNHETKNDVFDDGEVNPFGGDNEIQDLPR